MSPKNLKRKNIIIHWGMLYDMGEKECLISQEMLTDDLSLKNDCCSFERNWYPHASRAYWYTTSEQFFFFPFLISFWKYIYITFNQYFHRYFLTIHKKIFFIILDMSIFVSFTTSVFASFSEVYLEHVQRISHLCSSKFSIIDFHSSYLKSIS